MLVVQLATVEHPVVGRCRVVVSVDHSAELDKTLGRKVAGLKNLLYNYCGVCVVAEYCRWRRREGGEFREERPAEIRDHESDLSSSVTPAPACARSRKQ